LKESTNGKLPPKEGEGSKKRNVRREKKTLPSPKLGGKREAISPAG